MADEKKAPEAPATQAAPEVVAAKKNKKISQMSIAEVDEKLISVKEKMGRLDSRYAKELLKRKETLK